MIKIGDVVEFEFEGKKQIGIVYHHQQYQPRCSRSLVFVEKNERLHCIEDWLLTYQSCNIFDLIKQEMAKPFLMRLAEHMKREEVSLAERLLPKSWRRKLFPK